MLAAVAVQTVGAQSFRDASEIAGFRAAPIRLSPNFAGVVAPRLARAGCDTAIPNPYLRDRTEDSYIITYQNNALRYLGYRLSQKKTLRGIWRTFFKLLKKGEYDILKWRSEVAPVSWTPDYLGSRSPRWARQEQPTRLSSAAR
jgi:hypothetical protein